MTQSLKQLLKRSSKVAFITSKMGSIEDNLSGSSYGYRMSKVALSMAAKSLSIDLLNEDIYVAILHPGLVSTRMTGFTKNGISTEESSKGLLERIDSLNKVTRVLFGMLTEKFCLGKIYIFIFKRFISVIC